MDLLLYYDVKQKDPLAQKMKNSGLMFCQWQHQSLAKCSPWTFGRNLCNCLLPFLLHWGQFKTFYWYKQVCSKSKIKGFTNLTALHELNKLKKINKYFTFYPYQGFFQLFAQGGTKIDTVEFGGHLNINFWHWLVKSGIVSCKSCNCPIQRWSAR